MIKVFSMVTRFTKNVLGGVWGCWGGRVSGRVVSDGDKMRPKAELGMGGFCLLYNK